MFESDEMLKFKGQTLPARMYRRDVGNINVNFNYVVVPVVELAIS